MLGNQFETQGGSGMTGEHTGAVLFHCWSHEPKNRAREIFTSIVKRGLLMTITNGGALDSFTVRDGENNLRQIEVMQRPRICFTDIPMDLLATHGAGYGRYAVGFSRETVVEWGGCPAWYLPNHHGGDTLKDAGPLVVNGLHAAMVALDSYFACVRSSEDAFRTGQINERFFTQKFTHGKDLVGDELLQWLQYGRNCIERALSFVKEMSPPSAEDFRYLYEREWRIVEGIQIKGKDSCRPLTDDEKRELVAINPTWKNAPTTNDINIQVRYPSVPLIDSFRMFGGISDRVSQKIDVVLVPDLNEKQFVDDLVSKDPNAFRSGGPEVFVFPT